MVIVFESFRRRNHKKNAKYFSFWFVKEIAVVGNKVDLIDREEVKYDDAKNYAKVSRKMDNCD